MDLQISIVICAYNRANFVVKGLTSLYNQTADKSLFEVIVIDNNSKDNTKEVCYDFFNSHPNLKSKYVLEKNQGLSFARNKGIEMASAAIIAFIDDDATAREDYVENLITAFKNNPEYGALGGKVNPVYESGIEPVWMSKYIFGIVAKVDYGDKEKDFTKKFPTGCNMAFRKNLFEKYGGFNTDLVYRGDDKFVFINLKSNKIKILYAPSVYVNHFIDNYRIEPDHIDKISRTIGTSEKLRLQNKGFTARLSKSIEYWYKFTGALILFVLFTLKGQYPKGKYAVKIIWQTIIGFYSTKNFARL